MAKKLLFPHQLETVFIRRLQVEVAFAVAPKVPRFHYFPCQQRQPFHIADGYALVCAPSKFTITELFSTFLRFATCPTGDGCAFPASTHNVSNVVSGHVVLLSHSVKHYETIVFKQLIIDSFAIIIRFKISDLITQQESDYSAGCRKKPSRASKRGAVIHLRLMSVAVRHLSSISFTS